MTPLEQLQEMGQSLWLDTITRGLLTSGGLRRHMQEFCVTGLTSNPTIFDHAIKSSHDYDIAIHRKSREGKSGEALFFELALEDLRQAADLFRPIHDQTDGVDGSLGYPGPVLRGRPVSEPHNLAPGWVGFDFKAAFRRPVRVINDAAMQALGSYRGGKMLFLGLGAGLGSAMIVDGIVEPMELGHLPFRKRTYEDYVGLRGLKRLGKRKWRRYVKDVVTRLVAALEPEDVVLGGGNIHQLKKLPAGCRAGDNVNAFRGGFRLWEDAAKSGNSAFPTFQSSRRKKRRAQATPN